MLLVLMHAGKIALELALRAPQIATSPAFASFAVHDALELAGHVTASTAGKLCLFSSGGYSSGT
jgi:hypothetical protein